MDDARLRQLRDAGTIILWYSCSIVANAASKLVLTHGFRHPPTLAISQFALLSRMSPDHSRARSSSRCSREIRLRSKASFFFRRSFQHSIKVCAS